MSTIDSPARTESAVSLVSEIRSTASSTIVRMQVLGPFQAVDYLGQNLAPRQPKLRALLSILCMARGNAVPRHRLASLLWDGVTDAQAKASLRQALRELVRLLGDRAPEILEVTNHEVGLKSEAVWVDALAVLHHGTSIAGAASGTHFRSGLLFEELDGITDSLDHWLMVERSGFANELGALIEKELDRLASPDVPPAVCVVRSRNIITFDPLNESAFRILMSSLAKTGDRAGALREYARLEANLKATLDISPSREVTALRDAIRLVRDVRGPQTVVVPDQAQAPVQPAPSRQVRLRVGVLPFECIDERVDAHLPLAMAHEVAGALSRFRWFDVIAPTAFPPSPNRYTAWSASNRHFDYVLDGLICAQDDKLAVSVKLLDVTTTAKSVWSDTLAFELSALGNFLEWIVPPIVARVDPAILFIESSHGARNVSDGTSLLLQAIPLLYSLDRQSYERAGELLTRALEEEPGNAMIPAQRAFWLMFRMGQRWTHSRDESLREAEAMCLRAIRLDPANAQAVATYAHLCAFYHHDFETAQSHFDLALRLNPNLALAWALSAAFACYVGRPAEALERMARYRQLAPFDPYFGPFAETIYVIAHLLMGDYECAAKIGRRSVKANRDFTNGYKPLISALGHLGHRDDAAHYLEELLNREPSFSIAQFIKTYPFNRTSDRDHYVEGLRRAGVREN
jgi:DNA-binding SARP family transcriptional activator/Tfp pilus assembly protein PilF